MVSKPPKFAGLSLWPAKTCLASELAAELSTLSTSELRQTTVILPTQRLATWLLAMLSQTRQAFVPPRCFTFESFIHHTAAKLGVTVSGGLMPMGDLEQELVLASLLKEKREPALNHLHLGHEHELKQIFAELAEWSLEDRAFPLLLELVKNNVYLSEDSVDTLSERVLELEHLYRLFMARLEERYGAMPQALYLGRLSQALGARVGEQGLEQTLGGTLYLVGFTSAGGMHGPLLRALLESPQAAMWLSDVDLTGDDEAQTLRTPLGQLRAMLGSRTVHHRTPSRDSEDHGQAQLPMAVHRAESVLAEIAHALTLVQDAVKGGLPPSSVALLVANDSAYGKPLRALLRGSGITANVALGTPFHGTEIGSWLSSVLALAKSGEGTPEVLALASHPLTLGWWRRERRSLGHLLVSEGKGEQRERLARELYGTGISRGLSALAVAPLLTDEVAALLSALHRALGPLIGKSGPDGDERPLGEWAELLTRTADQFLLAHQAGDSTGGDDIGLVTSARTGLMGLLTALTRIGSQEFAELGMSEFLSLLESQLATLDVRSVGEPLSGLQVLSIAEARYVPFATAIILGCTEGDFPRGLPRDHLLDNYLKTKIGLPGWHLLEAIEDTTFQLLRARLPALFLLYPARRGNDDAVRSRFIETALARGESRDQTVNSDEALLALIAPMGGTPLNLLGRSERRQQGASATGRVDPALKGHYLRDLSATSVEALLHCPYRFALQKLGVEPTEIPLSDDPRREGNWLHQVLEAFFTGTSQGEELAPPLDPAQWRDVPTASAYALSRLTQLTERLAPPFFHDSPLALQLAARSWPRFVEHVLSLYPPPHLGQAASGWREASLTPRQGGAWQTQMGDHKVALRGKIDSVDDLGAFHLITDYKRSGTPPKAQVLRGLSPQLVLYGEAVAARTDETWPLENAVVGYWSILKGEWTGLLAGEDAAAKAQLAGLLPGSRRPGTSLTDVALRLRELWTWRLDELHPPEARFVPDASACDHCQFAAICLKDDPEVGHHTRRPLAAKMRAMASREETP